MIRKHRRRQSTVATDTHASSPLPPPLFHPALAHPRICHYHTRILTTLLPFSPSSFDSGGGGTPPSFFGPSKRLARACTGAYDWLLSCVFVRLFSSPPYKLLLLLLSTYVSEGRATGLNHVIYIILYIVYYYILCTYMVYGRIYPYSQCVGFPGSYYGENINIIIPTRDLYIYIRCFRSVLLLVFVYYIFVYIILLYLLEYLWSVATCNILYFVFLFSIPFSYFLFICPICHRHWQPQKKIME